MLTKGKWYQFERLVERIQRAAAPDAQVAHNVHVEGKSGIRRQLDITIHSPSGYRTLFTLVECKFHKRLVGMKDVEALVMMREDVGADRGVIVSASGFTHGAKAIAKWQDVQLETLREAMESDWGNVLGERPTANILVQKFELLAACAALPDGSWIDLERDAPVFDGTERVVCTVAGLLDSMEFHDAVRELHHWFQDVVPFELTPSRPLYVRVSGRLTEAAAFQFNLQGKVFAYQVDAHFGGGQVVQDAASDQALFAMLSTQGVDWRPIVDGSGGREVTKEELDAFVRSGMPTINLDLRRAKSAVALTIGMSVPVSPRETVPRD